MNLPFAPSKQGLSALETLAEVSRQHLDLSGKHISGKQQQQLPQLPQQPQRSSPPPLNNANNQGALLDEFLIQDDKTDGHDFGGVSQGMDTSNAAGLPSIYQAYDLPHSPAGSPHLNHIPMSSSGSMQQMMPSLVMTASAANDLANIMPLQNGLMEPDLNLSNNAISDKFFHSQGRQQWPNLPQSSIDPLLHDHNREQTLPKDDSITKSMQQPRPIAMSTNGSQAHFTTDFSMSPKPNKPKVRGRFSDSRRKEVQEVRKRGACIRCRMLKKPCSGDSPCSTCQNVESARLWKQPCIRTRIAEEFNLYSAGLHGILAFQAVSQAKNQIRFDQITGRIEALHHPDSGTMVTFTPLRSQSQIPPGSDIDPAILASLSPSNLEIIDSDDDIGGKLDLYIKKVAQSFYDSEDSSFMQTTTRIAQGITSSNQDYLLAKVLELWNLTRILTSKSMAWQLFSNPSHAPTMAATTISSTELENATRTPITIENNPSSYELIKMQLQGATEKRAACLARVVMNDLERRLLQRQQANPFETFLVAIILLACVERMCWLFRTWEEPTSSSTANIESSHSQSQPPHPDSDEQIAATLQSEPLSNTQARPPKWPFDKLPAYYSQQGERFSDILNMLLKMRGVPPKPVARSSDGMLVMWGEEVDSNVRDWYDGIAVTLGGLEERSHAHFVGEDSKEWELKYVGKIIGGH
jgi:hypothetical protein